MAFLAYQVDQTVVIDKLKELIKDFPRMLDQDAKDMVIACEKAKKVVCALGRSNAPKKAQPQTPTWVPTSRTHLLKNPMFWTFFFKEEDKRAMDILLEGKLQSGGAEWQSLEGAFANVPMLPPRRYELDLSSQDGRSWAVQNLYMLTPFTNEIWKVLASVTDKEIEECKRRALLTNSPAKCTLAKSWGMHMFFAVKYLCEEKAIILVRSDFKTGSNREHKHMQRIWNWHRPFFKCDCFSNEDKKES